MLEAVEGLPSNVIGIVAKGRVTALECRTVLRPMIRGAFKQHQTLRLYYELHSRYPGAGWDALNLGLTKLPAWERAAVVSDTSWVRQMASAFLFFIAKDTRVFSNSEISDAKAWIMSGIEAPATESRIEPFRPPVPPTIELPTRPGQPSRRGTHLYKRP
jgi:stage II sporulation SpoAA-like protein